MDKYWRGPLVILGLVFSLIGFFRARSGKAANKGLALAGAVLSVIGLIVCIVWVDGLLKAADETVTISYAAGGDSKGATVTYTTFSDGGSSEGQVTTNLPWHKDVRATGFVRGGTLSVTAGEDGGTVTCQVAVDGKVQKTASASGPLATATCDNF